MAAQMIFYDTYLSPFGLCFIALLEKDVCQILFLEKRQVNKTIKNLHDLWPKEDIRKDEVKIKTVAKKIFNSSGIKRPVGYVLQGTSFQLKVWEALLPIPKGQTSTYFDIARTIGSPKASRAVGTACATNQIAFLIPCHRVLTSGGGLGGYRWGLKRKKAILEWEAVT